MKNPDQLPPGAEKEGEDTALVKVGKQGLQHYTGVSAAYIMIAAEEIPVIIRERVYLTKKLYLKNSDGIWPFK